MRTVEFSKGSVVVAGEVVSRFDYTYGTRTHLRILPLRTRRKSSIILKLLLILIVKHLWGHLLLTVHIWFGFINVWIVTFSTLNISILQVFQLIGLCYLSLMVKHFVFLLWLLVSSHIKNVLIIPIGPLPLVKWVLFINWLCVLILVLGKVWRILMMCHCHHLSTNICVLMVLWVMSVVIDFTGSSMDIGYSVICSVVIIYFEILILTMIQIRCISRGWPWIQKALLFGFWQNCIDCVIQAFGVLRLFCTLIDNAFVQELGIATITYDILNKELTVFSWWLGLRHELTCSLLRTLLYAKNIVLLHVLYFVWFKYFLKHFETRQRPLYRCLTSWHLQKGW